MWEKITLFIAIFALGISMTNSYIIYRDDVEMQERALDVIIERLTNQMTRDQVREMAKWRQSLVENPPRIRLNFEPCQMEWWEWMKDYTNEIKRPMPDCIMEQWVGYSFESEDRQNGE